MKLTNAVRQQFRSFGTAGGRARARNLTARERSAAARYAVVKRWTRERFGAPSFSELALPGAEIVDAGIADLCAGRETPESLLVSLAAPRLKREGVPLPRQVFDDAERRLYRMLERHNEGLAHARYLAYLDQAVSFSDACARARLERASRAK